MKTCNWFPDNVAMSSRPSPLTSPIAPICGPVAETFTVSSAASSDAGFATSEPDERPLKSATNTATPSAVTVTSSTNQPSERLPTPPSASNSNAIRNGCPTNGVRLIVTFCQPAVSSIRTAAPSSGVFDATIVSRPCASFTITRAASRSVRSASVSRK